VKEVSRPADDCHAPSPGKTRNFVRAVAGCSALAGASLGPYPARWVPCRLWIPLIPILTTRASEVAMGFARFMSSGYGRLLRIAVGAGIIALGLTVVGGTWGWVLAVVGLIPALAGLFDVCLIGAIFFGTPWRGAEIRAG